MRTLCTIGVAVLSVSLAAGEMTAQTASPAADSRDVESVDAILAALHDVISGDSGVARDWDRFRSLFAPGARLIPVGQRPGGAYGARVLTPDEYVEASGPYLVNNGFHEREIARRSESYGQIVHAFSTYEAGLTINKYLLMYLPCSSHPRPTPESSRRWPTPAAGRSSSR